MGRRRNRRREGMEGRTDDWERKKRKKSIRYNICVMYNNSICII